MDTMRTNYPVKAFAVLDPMDNDKALFVLNSEQKWIAVTKETRTSGLTGTSTQDPLSSIFASRINTPIGSFGEYFNRDR